MKHTVIFGCGYHGRAVYRIIYLKTFIYPHQANLIQDYSRIQMEADAKKKQEAIDKRVTLYTGEIAKAKALFDQYNQ